MATKNIVPRADGEGTLGTAVKNWLKGFFKTIFLGSSGIVDSNSNEVLKPESVADAINEITIKNAAESNAPEVKATGGDTNIDLLLVPKGSGKSKTSDQQIIVKTAPAMTAGKMLKSNADGVVEDGTNTDTEVADAVTKKHSKDADADLDPTFEATFVKKVDTVNVLSDITSPGADIEDAVTKRHGQNTDTGSDADPFTLTGKFKRSSQVGITAYATGGQVNAEVVTKDIAEISVCATEGDSVKLPPAEAGLVILITNHGVAAANVFPNTDDAINGAAINTAKSLGIDASILCIAYDVTNWECLTLAR